MAFNPVFRKAIHISLLTISCGALIASASEERSMRTLYKISDEDIARVASGGTQHSDKPVAGYGPAQLKTAYGIDQSSREGAGQVIALIDAYGNPTMEADLNTFSQQYGLPQTGEFKFKVINAEGAPDTSGSVANGWMAETTLDVEWAHAIAPQASILVVVAKSPSMTNLMKAVDLAVSSGATVVSMSFGGPEGKSAKALASADKHFDKTGVTFVTGSGDSGTGVSYPASSPYVISVGGTTLPLDASGKRTGKETAWAGSGGGTSALESAPSYQSQAQSSSMRTVPDVAYNADPKTGYSIYFSNPLIVSKGKKSGSISGWFEVGGTSAGAPQWAAIIADANSERSGATTTADNLKQLYSIGASSDYADDFTDITSGCDGKAAADCAKSGYDLVTGLGSPLVRALLPELSRD